MNTHRYGIPFKQVIRQINYVGAILFVFGAVPILMEIVWTTVYDSNDAHVEAPLVIDSFFSVCFALWETFAKIKHPLTPTHIFTSAWGRDFTAPAIALAVVNSSYHSNSIV